MRIETQLINKILKTDLEDYFTNGGSLDILQSNKEELQYILDHYERYGSIVDVTTFRRKFPQFEYGEVGGNVKSLIEELKEQKNFEAIKAILEEASEIAVDNSFEAARFLRSGLNQLREDDSIHAIDIIHDISRGEEYKRKLESGISTFISTGLPELDSIVKGYQREGEEFVVVVARTSHGKSFFLVKTVHAAWESGLRVGFVSPEMSPTSIGYRFDTIHEGISNSALIAGFGVPEYSNYLDTLSKSHNNPYYVATPKMLGGAVTVSKLREFCLKYDLDFLAVDGITYLKDERYRGGDSKTTSLTNISEDLFQLSLELKIPVVVVAQANRDAVSDDVSTPDLSHIRDSDGIGHNATMVLGMARKGTVLEIGVKKNRNGENDGYVKYNFIPDRGEYSYLPDDYDAVAKDLKEESMEAIKKEFEGHDIEF